MAQIKSDLLARFALRPDAPGAREARPGGVPATCWSGSTTSRASVGRPGGRRRSTIRSTPPRTPTGRLELANSLVTVARLAGSTARSRSTAVPGFNRLVDSGDHGDTYNYSPPEHDVVVDDSGAGGPELVESGPVRAVAVAKRTYNWPESIDDGKRARTGEREVVVTSRIEVRAGEPLVRVTTSFDNTCRDHRLRAWFPLPEPADHSSAECAFAVVERGLFAEGGPSERALATYPSRRFVQAGGLTVCHDGLCEYELVDLAEPGGSTGTADDARMPPFGRTASRSPCSGLPACCHGSRCSTDPCRPAPPTPSRARRCKARSRLRYAVAVGELDGYALADDAFTDLPVLPSLGGGRLPLEGSMLSVSGAEVSARPARRRRRPRGPGLQPRCQYQHRRNAEKRWRNRHRRSPGADAASGPARRPARPLCRQLRRQLRARPVSHRDRKAGRELTAGVCSLSPPALPAVKPLQLRLRRATHE